MRRLLPGLLLLVALMGLDLPARSAQAATCNSDQNLPAGAGEDLEVTGPGTCVVQAGTYHYGKVNVYQGGVLTFTDSVIDFWATAILIEKDGSLLAGTEAVPIGTAPGARVTIHLYGEEQSPGTGQGDGGVGITCKTDVRCGVAPADWIHNPTDKVLLPGGVTDYFYAYHPLPYDDGDPNAYFGYKVLAVSYGGTLKLFGKRGATYGPLPASNSGTSWGRLSGSLAVGVKRLVMDRDVDWRVGDEIVVTTTDYLPGHSERLIITNVGADKRTIDFVKPGSLHGEGVDWIHNGSLYDLQDRDNPVPARLGLPFTTVETRAAVALLTRSIQVVSAGDAFGEAFPEPDDALKPRYHFGGHTMFRQGVQAVQIQGVEFRQLGQGGRQAHYPVHGHLARWLPANTFIKDSSINESMTRWVTLHGTQNLLLARNVGYLSIGHGFYLEDGTETDNVFQSNIGIYARAAVDNPHNPRKVPGILASPDIPEAENVPYHTDWDHPSVFWIMNGWNDFEHNVAVGAGACGACYWLLPGYNGGPSREQKWASYASLQADPSRAGITPLKRFVGNQCTCAMNAFNTVGNTTRCLGVGPSTDEAIPFISNPLAPGHLPKGDPATVDPRADNYYPKVDAGGGRWATRCAPGVPGATVDSKGDLICSQVAKCGNGNAATNCEVTVLDRFTTAFNWAETNFSAVWLRPQWFLVENSVISDVQNAGLTFVSGGDYTRSSSPGGNWLVVRKSVFIGNTQDNDANPLASNAGPFRPGGLSCDNKPETINYCVSVAEGISMPLSNFGVNQRLFNIYDGPAQQDSNAYLDITRTDLTTAVGNCTRGQGNCQNSPYMYGKVQGIPWDPVGQRCVLPNAAIAWKQPNGFYYPPSFHSANLFFDNVDIRHFVVEPLFKVNSRETDVPEVLKAYCTHTLNGTFADFTSVDRQTVLNDDDGTLTGLVDTISVNEDPFFNAPVETLECLSDATAKTSPYQYVTTAIYPGCAANQTDALATEAVCDAVDWAKSCSDPDCAGVPLYRQFILPGEGPRTETSIRLASQAIWQRSTLTANHGTYFVDTTRTKGRQLADLEGRPNKRVNVFREGQAYYLYQVFAKPSTRITYQIYVGDNFNADTSQLGSDLKAVRTSLLSATLGFQEFPWPAGWPVSLANGVLEVTIDLAAFASQFAAATDEACQPAAFCTVQGGACRGAPAKVAERCADVLGNPDLLAACRADTDAACGWANKDVDCPAGGCLGFAFTLRDDPTRIDKVVHFVEGGLAERLVALASADRTSARRPTPQPFPSDERWSVAFRQAPADLAGACALPVVGVPGSKGEARNVGLAGQGELTLSGDFAVPAGFDLAATQNVVLNLLLREAPGAAGGDELVQGAGPGARALPINLGRTAPAVGDLATFATSAGLSPAARLSLRSGGPDRGVFGLLVNQVSIDPATGCPGGTLVPLGTSLAVYSGGDAIELTLNGQWNCSDPTRYVGEVPRTP